MVELICEKVLEEQLQPVRLVADPTIEEGKISRILIKFLEKNGFYF